jgi:hypothetical protein
MVHNNDSLNMEGKGVAIVYNDKNSYFTKLMINRDVKVFLAYKEVNSLLRILRKIHFKMKFPFINMWFDDELKNLKNYNTIILFDATLTNTFVRKLRKNFPEKRLIFWYWNPVESSINPKKLNDDVNGKWSYSPVDCENYHLHSNTTFYFKELFIKEDKTRFDVFFVGKDKGRLNSLLDLKIQFEKLGLETYFHITATKWFLKKSNPVYKKPISYSEVLSGIGKSKAILDLLSNTKDGLSLRSMESIFLKKKLITNSETIFNYDFYRPQNIFVIGYDNFDNLPEFLNSPYEEINEDIVASYDFNCWLDRFLN